MTIRYVRFSHGCLITDCVEDDLRKVASTADLLSFYGLYRQAMCGDNDRPQPSLIYAEQRLKWNAWTKCKGLSKEEALSKWEAMYNHFLSSFPAVFEGYDADLSRYDPFQSLNAKISALQSELRMAHRPEMENGKSLGNGSVKKGIQYVTVQRDQYQTIIDQVNQFKNKMQKYHHRFQLNAQQIQSLKQENDALKAAAKKESVPRRGPKSSGLSVVMCLMLIVAVLYFYKKRKNKM